MFGIRNLSKKGKSEKIVDSPPIEQLSLPSELTQLANIEVEKPKITEKLKF